MYSSHSLIIKIVLNRLYIKKFFVYFCTLAILALSYTVLFSILHHLLHKVKYRDPLYNYQYNCRTNDLKNFKAYHSYDPVLIFTFHVQWVFIEEIYIIDAHRVIVPHPSISLG